ncbi:MAG TPA: hypothetical protein VGD31_04630, partial [Sphingobacteriaceae bacterium]
MKKLATYVLVLLLLLNVMGYYGVFIGLKYSHSSAFDQRLDDFQYLDSHTVTLKVPLSIPYYGDTEYQRVNGEIEHEGEVYRLVKQKYEKDTLYIVCIRDFESKRIKQALADYVKNFSEHSSDNAFKTVPSFIKEYITPGFAFSSSSSGWNQDIP